MRTSLSPLHLLENAAAQVTARETARERCRLSFLEFMAHIKAARWWQCCCGQNEIPPAASASTLEPHAVVWSWLSQPEAALAVAKVSERLLPRLVHPEKGQKGN